MTILDDPTVSYKAIGVYYQMQATPDDFSLTRQYLMDMHTDDYDSVMSALDELFKAGWLRIGPMKKDGKFCGYFWQFLKKEASQ